MRSEEDEESSPAERLQNEITRMKGTVPCLYERGRDGYQGS